MRKLRGLLIASVLMTAPAYGDDNPVNYAEVISAMSALVGGGVEAEIKAGQRVVSITIDRSKVNQNIDKFQELKLLNPDITQTFVNTHQNPAALAIATQFAVMEVITEYRTNKTDHCAFVVNFLVPDDYGHAQKIPVFAFGFDRKLFNKINWDNFDNSKLSKVAYQYQMSNWAKAHFMD